MIDEKVKNENGESQEEVRNRMLSLIDELLNKEQIEKIVLVTHAAAMTFLLMNWCTLESVKLDGKKRKLKYKDKIIIDDSFNTSEIFKLTFVNKNLYDIERIIDY